MPAVYLHFHKYFMTNTDHIYLRAGMERLQKSMNTYVKHLSRRCDGFEDKEKGLPISFLGRTMIAHGEDFEPNSEFGNCLIGESTLKIIIDAFLANDDLTSSRHCK